MSKHSAVWLTCLCLVLPAFLAAHENHEHKAMGTVTKLDQDQLTVEVKDGESLEIQLTAKTQYMRGEVPATAQDVQVRDRVVVFYVQEKAKKRATRVLLPPAKKTGG